MVVSVGSRPARRGTGSGATATLAALGSNVLIDELSEIYPSPGAAIDRAANGSRPLPPTP
jgi:hypothetical protein